MATQNYCERERAAGSTQHRGARVAVGQRPNASRLSRRGDIRAQAPLICRQSQLRCCHGCCGTAFRPSRHHTRTQHCSDGRCCFDASRMRTARQPASEAASEVAWQRGIDRITSRHCVPLATVQQPAARRAGRRFWQLPPCQQEWMTRCRSAPDIIGCVAEAQGRQRKRGSRGLEAARHPQTDGCIQVAAFSAITATSS